MMNAIGVTNLRKSSGEFQAVQDATFQADFGEVLSLLSPNGAGKSTTIPWLLATRPGAKPIYCMRHAYSKSVYSIRYLLQGMKSSTHRKFEEASWIYLPSVSRI
jgi:ABC-type uncharacterized transport system ATPase subunit